MAYPKRGKLPDHVQGTHFGADLSSLVHNLYVLGMTQLYLLMYLLIFSSAIRLRFRYPNVQRPYKVPGGIWGILICGLIGVGVAIFSLSIGLIPPKEISTCSPKFYRLFLVGAIVLFSLIPFYLNRKRTEKIALEN